MTQHVHAIFAEGVLRPLSPLNLQDQEVVALSIEPLVSEAPAGEDASSTLLDVLDEAGLVGCIKDGPADLSTNPRYLEGFGTSGR